MTEPTAPAVVNLVDERTGEVVNVNESDLPGIGAGYRLATDDEITRDLERQQYGEGLGNEAAAFGEGVLSGATVGLSDVAAKYIAPEYAAGLAKRRQHNETAAAVGEGAGILGAALLTGGLSGEASLAARGAQALTAPARGLLALGEATTAGVGRLVGAEAAQGVLGQAVRQGIAYGTGGAVEGALFGAAKTVTDDYLNDHEITAERVKAGMGEGALWGAGLGLGTGVTGSLLGSAGRKVASMWDRSDADRAATTAADNAIEATAGVGTSAEAEVSGQALSVDQKLHQQMGFSTDDQVLAEMSVPTTPERQTALEKVRHMAEQADAAERFDALRTQAANEIVDEVATFRRLEVELDDHINAGRKREAYKAQLETTPPDWSPEKVEAITGSIADTEKQLIDLREDSTALSTTQHAAIRDAIKAGQEIQGRLKGFSGRTAGQQVGPLAPDAPVFRMDADAIAEIAELHDQYKRALGRAARKAGNDTAYMNTGEGGLRREYMKHRGGLEDETIYGPGMTEMQRQTNAAESQAIKYQKAWDQLFGMPEGLQTEAADRGVHGAFDNLNEADYDKVYNYLGKAGANPQHDKIFALGLQRQADKLKVKSDFYPMSPAMRAKAVQAQEIAKRVLGRTREVRAVREMAEQYTQEMAKLSKLPFYGDQLAKLKISMGRTANVIASAATDTTATATGGRAVARSAAQSAVRAGIRGEEAMGRAGRGIVRWLREAGKATGEATVKAGRAVTKAAKGGPLLGVSLSVDQPATVERLIRNIGSMQDPSSDERRAMRVGAFPIRQENPQLAAALEAHTQRVADFLSDKAGDLSAIPKPGDPFGRLRDPRHSAAKAAKLARYVAAATNPAGALDRIGNGEVVREDVEALQQLYPRLYQRMVSEVLMNLSTVDQLPTYETRIRLGHLLNAPTDPSMQPERAAALQELAKTGAQPGAQQQDTAGEPVLSPSQRRAPTKLGRMYATSVDRQATDGALTG